MSHPSMCAFAHSFVRWC